MVERRRKLLVFEDSIGITKAYLPMFKSLLDRNGIKDTKVTYQIRSSYRAFNRGLLLEWRKTRKQPGYNTNPKNMKATFLWVMKVIQEYNPDVVLCMDPALLFILNRDWNQATLDRLRGGVYIIESTPWLVTLPVTALNTRMKSTDIAKLNQGYTEKGDFDAARAAEDDEDEDDESDDSDEIDEKVRLEWHEPIIVPYGRFVLDKDIQKLARLIARTKE